jgi:hypothetical protein
LESAEAEVVALAVAVALGLTLAAAEMVAAVVEPAVAVTLAVVDDVAEVLPLDVCARATEANRATKAAKASIMTAADSSGIFLLNNNSPSSYSGTTYRRPLYRHGQVGVSPK